MPTFPNQPKEQGKNNPDWNEQGKWFALTYLGEQGAFPQETK